MEDACGLILPYSRPLIELFVRKLVEHGNGIALLFNRCDSNNSLGSSSSQKQREWNSYATASDSTDQTEREGISRLR